MHWNPEISLGTVFVIALQAVFGLLAFVKFNAKADTLIQQHTELIRELRRKFDAHEEEDDRKFERLEARITDLVAGLQRMVGRTDFFRRRTRVDEDEP